MRPCPPLPIPAPARRNGWSLTLIAFVVAFAACKNELRPVLVPPVDHDAASEPGRPLSEDGPGNRDLGPSGACTSETYVGQPAPLDLTLLLDVSTSMTTAPVGFVSRWELLSRALKSYLRAPVDPSLGLGIQVFPLPARCANATACEAPETCEVPQACANAEGPLVPRTPCGNTFPLCPPGTACLAVGRCAVRGQSCSDIGRLCPGRVNDNVCVASPSVCIYDGVMSPSCAPGDYARFVFPIGLMSGGRGASAIDVIDEQAPEQNFGTPLGPALEGTVAHLRSHRAMHPERRVVLAVITDGEITACSPSAPSEVVGPVRQVRANDGITTHVIALTDDAPIPTENLTMLDALASAGGGGPARFLDLTENLPLELRGALDTVHARERPCAFDIEATALRNDGRSLDVSLTAAGMTRTVSAVANTNACVANSDGWFATTAPTGGARLGLCERTCQRLRDDPAATLEVRRRCPGT
ncbi:MAG TPA: vWA domain-containing protein [Polyangia bacterium]